MPFLASSAAENKTALTFAGFSLIPAFGIACFRLSAWTLYSSEVGAQDLNMLFVSRMMQLCSIVLALIIDRRLPYSRKTLLNVMAAAAFCAMLGAAIHLVAAEEIYSYIGVGINGAAAGVLMLGWGFYLCSVRPQASAFSITSAFALHGIMTWVLPAVPQQSIAVLTIFLPFVSMLLLRKSIDDLGSQLDSELSLNAGTLKAFPRSVFALLFMCTIASIFVKFYVPLGSVLRSSPYYLSWPAIPVLIFVVYFAWMVAAKRSDQEALWPIFVLIIFSGLFCYSIFSTTQPEFAEGFLNATSECLMLFCWIVTAPFVYRNKLPRIFSFGVSVTVFIIPPTIVSSLLAMAFPSIDTLGDGHVAIIVTAILAFTLIVATGIALIANALTMAQVQKTVDGAEESSSVERAVGKLASEYGLTNREREVTLCLAKGYSFPQTAEALFISIDTVRTHAKSLYRKMGINKKRQLIEQVEACRTDS